MGSGSESRAAAAVEEAVAVAAGAVGAEVVDVAVGAAEVVEVVVIEQLV